MRTIKLVLAYDGHAYHGFQKQKNVVTVQGLLEEALAKLCAEQVVTAGSGRTDARVHAFGQVVTFTTSGRIPSANMVRALRTLLPADIIVLSAEEVAEGFHARYSATSKTYQYRVVQNTVDSPFLLHYAWQVHAKLDVVAMNTAAQLLLGTHNFSAFRSTGSVEGSPIKTMTEARWDANGEELLFTITGDGFLYHMVRNIVWSLVQVGLGKRTIAEFAEELESERTVFESTPAPAQGLYLLNVQYG